MRETAHNGEVGNEMIERLPYGLWTHPDGTEILFNRGHRAIWRRGPEGTAEPTKQVFMGEGCAERWFRDDATLNPRRTGEGITHALLVLGLFVSGADVRHRLLPRS